MNILLVIADLGLGGAQQVVVNLANELAEQGQRVWIYDVYPEMRKNGMVSKLSDRVNLISRKFETTPKNLIEKSINSLTYRSKWNTKYLNDKRLKQHRKELQKVLQAVSFDCVNSHVYWADEFVFEELSYLHTNWWITLHGSYSGFILSEDYQHEKKQIERFLSECEGYIYLADTELDILKQVPSWDLPKRNKIYNGIPLPRNSNVPHILPKWDNEHPMKLLIAARAIREKGWEEAILAVCELVAEGYNVELKLAGDGPDLEEILAKYEYFQFIHFLGYRSDIEELIKWSDLILLPSYFVGEALPTILLEAISIGKPTIATDVGEIKAILSQENDCGILIDPDPEKLVSSIKNALLTYYKDHQLYTNHERNCQENVKIFSIDLMAKNYVELFSLVNEKHGA